MEPTNPNQPFIDKVNGLCKEAEAIVPADGNRNMIIGGLHTARDFALQHGREQLRVKAEAEKKAAEAAEAAKAAEPQKPTEPDASSAQPEPEVLAAPQSTE